MVIIGIMKSKGIYDPYVFMGNWGGSHGPVTADGDLTLTPSTTGNYENSKREITLTITSATYTNKSSNETLTLSDTSNSTLKLTSDTAITSGGQTYTLNRSSLTLTLTAADTNFTPGIYNVFLNITSNISLTGTTTIKLKQTKDSEGKQTTVSLGTYNITTTGNTKFTGTPQDTDLHSSHQSTNCCFFGKQNTWSTKPKMSTALYIIFYVS
uniref:Uncharacterized protein n=1 Tax=Theileria annulata TaxID=5874 RepID=A0A3B0MFL1_THEAN